jgi:tetratricopeptide (TPR) repeat protein
MKDFEQCFALDTNNSKALSNIATIKFISGNIFESIENYTLAIEISPSESILYANRAKAKHKLKMLQEAMEDCEKAITLDLENVELYFLQGMLNFDLENYDASIADFTFAIEKSSIENSEYFYYRAISYHQIGNKENALKDYDKAILLNPKNAEAFYNRGLVKKEMNDQKGYEKDLETAKKLGFKDLNAEFFGN